MQGLYLGCSDKEKWLADWAPIRYRTEPSLCRGQAAVVPA